MLTVWGRADSSNVQKVLWCLDELGVAYKRIDIGGAFGGNDTAGYRAKNPNGLVPAVEDDDLVLWESNSILRYLAAKYGEGRLWPADPGHRARTERWMDWQLSTAGPALVPVFWGLIRTPPAERNSAAIEAARAKYAALMPILDRQLAAEPYLSGSSFGVGDIPMGVCTYRWYTLDVVRPDTPNLQAWYGRLQERPAFRAHVMCPLT